MERQKFIIFHKSEDILRHTPFIAYQGTDCCLLMALNLASPQVCKNCHCQQHATTLITQYCIQNVCRRHRHASKRGLQRGPAGLSVGRRVYQPGRVGLTAARTGRPQPSPPGSADRKSLRSPRGQLLAGRNARRRRRHGPESAACRRGRQELLANRYC